MNNEILLKVDEIIKTIENSQEYQKYLLLQKQIEQNRKIKTLINEVRILQKDVLHKVKTEDELKRKMDELNNQPLYREYTNVLYEINNVYNIIETSLNNYFSEKMN